MYILGHAGCLPSAAVWARRTPHPVIVTIRDSRDYIRVLFYSYKLASAQVRPLLLVSSSQFLTGTPWHSRMLLLALLLSFPNWPQGWSSFECNAQETAHRATMAQSIENLDQRLRGQEALLTGDGTSVLSTAEPVARPQEWTVTAADDDDAPITRAECAAMITQALQDKVAPAMGAMHTHYGMQFQAHRQRTESLEQEVQKLKIRTAWVEKDVMYQQIEVAKRTLVLRGFPEWMSHADRELTVDKAVREAGLTGTDWDLTTSSMDDGQEERKLSQVSILTVPTFSIRNKLLNHSSRLYAWYWKEEKITPTTTTEGADLSTITGFDQRAEQGSG